MRLYLSSFRLGLNPSELVRLAGGRGAKTLFVANAVDMLDEAAREATIEKELVDLRGIGLDATELDLRDHFQDPDGLERAVQGADLIWVRGGNTFVLRRAMAVSRFESSVLPLVRSGSIAYGGYGAGFCVLAPSLRSIELVDDPHDVPPGYDEDVIWDGLNVIDFTPAPHYRSMHPESADVEKMVAYCRENNIEHRTYRDGEVLVVDGSTESTIGFDEVIGDDDDPV